MMKKQLLSGLLVLSGRMVLAQNRFPRPDFESGYVYPDIHYAAPDESLWVTIDILLLVVMMSIIAWAAVKKRTRKPVVWVSIISVAYFGFYREGCVCSIGSIQNIALAFADSSYILPVSVSLFFLLPVVFAFLFGRVFCAGVCPFGALQELVNIKNYRLSRAVTTLLGMIPWLYLIFAVLYAVTRSSFILCRFDPFIGLFRLGGDFGLIVFGSLLLISSLFIGRPFCRFLCPYGALLSLFSRVSIWKIEITQKSCINCDLCRNACPADAIRPPYDNKVKESRLQGVKRLLAYFAVLPLMIAAGAFLMRSFSENLSRANKDVRLYEMVVMQENDPQDVLPLELETFYGQGSSIEELAAKNETIQAGFTLYSTIAGAFTGLVIGLVLIGLSLKRTRKQYEIEHAACVACGRCFNYCPQNINTTESAPL
jgi:polyferredoxin